MWPWEFKPPTGNFLDNNLYEGPYLFVALYRFYKATFWGNGIHIGPNRPIYQRLLIILDYTSSSPSWMSVGCPKTSLKTQMFAFIFFTR